VVVRDIRATTEPGSLADSAATGPSPSRASSTQNALTEPPQQHRTETRAERQPLTEDADRADQAEHRDQVEDDRGPAGAELGRGCSDRTRQPRDRLLGMLARERRQVWIGLLGGVLPFATSATAQPVPPTVSAECSASRAVRI
jgi:hypothetical protein